MENDHKTMHTHHSADNFDINLICLGGTIPCHSHESYHLSKWYPQAQLTKTSATLYINGGKFLAVEKKIGKSDPLL